jgi:hypothetical protein
MTVYTFKSRGAFSAARGLHGSLGKASLAIKIGWVDYGKRHAYIHPTLTGKPLQEKKNAYLRISM